MEEILSLVNDRSSIPLHMMFSGSINGKSITFNHNIYPSEILTDFDSSYKKMNEYIIQKINTSAQEKSSSINLGVQFYRYPNPVQISIAKWDIEFDGNIITSNINTPQTQYTVVNPYRIAKFIDLLSQTSINENLQIYSSLKRERKLENVTNEIRTVFPKIKGFNIIPYPDGSLTPISIIKNDNTMLPIYSYGDGIQRWFYILGSIILYKNSIICIDEIDTGFHISAQKELCKRIIQYARINNVQLFITMHNVEFIDNYLKSLDEIDMQDVNDSRIITIRNIKSELKIRTLSAQEALNARVKDRGELR